MHETLNDAIGSYDRRQMQQQLEKVWRHNESSDISFADIEAEIAAVRTSKTAQP